MTPSCLINVEGDGNCIFRCISLALHGTQEKHSEIRAAIVETMSKDEAFYGQRIDGDIKNHLSCMSKDRTWATEAEIFAASEFLDRDIMVYDQRLKSSKWTLHSRSGICNHTRKFIAIHHESDHFSLVDISKRPCICKNDIHHEEDLESREGAEEITKQKWDQDMSLELDVVHGDGGESHICNPKLTKESKQCPSNTLTNEDML